MKYSTVFLSVFVAVATGARIDWRIVGGDEAKIGQFPHHVSVRVWGSHNCGGSILNSRWILTAAHCLAVYDASDLTVVAGTNSLKDTQIGETYGVEIIKTHEDYDPWDITNDVGLIKVNRLISFNDVIKPIEINTVDFGGNEDVTLCGWGSTSYPGSLPDMLQFINLKSISLEECQEKYKQLVVLETQVCTLTKAGEGACYGDSGGALTYKGKVAGIVSWGKPCAKGYPDVFTRVSKFSDWIVKNMN